MQRSANRISFTKLIALSIGASLIFNEAKAKEIDLPECANVEYPEDIEIPTNVNIPDNFEITCDMVEQYIQYLKNSQQASEAPPMTGDRWFTELAGQYKSSNVYDVEKNLDQNGANEESAFEEKFMETMLSKSIILPVIVVTLIIIACWGFATKCGKKGCCQKEERRRVPEAQTKKSVKSERSETASNVDLENRSHMTNANSDGVSSIGTGKISKNKESDRVIKQNQADDVSMSNKFGRASIGSTVNQSRQASKLELAASNRNSTLSAPVAS